MVDALVNGLITKSLNFTALVSLTFLTVYYVSFALFLFLSFVFFSISIASNKTFPVVSGLGFEDPNNIVIQASPNNGIAWQTLNLVRASFNEGSQLINVKLPRNLRYDAVIFRWWMADLNSGMNEEVVQVQYLQNTNK